MKTIYLDGSKLTIEQLYEISHSPAYTYKLEIDPKALENMKKSRAYVEKIVKSEKPVYGINTGFGALADKYIQKEDLATLQVNLIRSHCTGVGESFSPEVTKAIML